MTTASDAPEAGRKANGKAVKKIGWKPTQHLRNGLETTYHWIAEQLDNLTIDKE